MSDRRTFRWATTGVRVLAGTVVAAAFSVGVVSAVAAPWPSIVNKPVQITATPAPTETILACTGGLLALGRTAGSAEELTLAAAQGVTAGTASADTPPTEFVLATKSVGGEGPSAYSAPPVDGVRTDAAASGSAVASADDLRGFAASACRPPLMESWLVGGASTTGSSDLVLLSNPGAVPATVQLTVYGAGGPEVPPGGMNVVVDAGAQVVIPLAGLVLGEESPIVQVTATGAPVQAALQSSLTRGLAPTGVDQIGAVAATASDVVIPGVAVTETPGADGASDAATVVRLLSPSAETSATVTVTAVGSTEPALAPSVVPLTAGLPTEVQLGGLPIGQYTVRVNAGLPVLAAVWQSAGSGEALDFAWYSAAPPISSPSLFATPVGVGGVLTIVNTDAAAATVKLTSVSGGAVQDITVPAGGSNSVRLPTRSVFLLDPGATAVRAGLSFAGDGALAAFPVWPSDAAAQSIAVYP